MKNNLTLFLVIYSLILSIVLIYEHRQLNSYKEALELNSEGQNILIMKMDESCYTQFTNNMDKALFIKMRFDK